jgi:ribonuclease P protein component
LRLRTDFAATLRAGRGRAGSSAGPALLVVHLAHDAGDDADGGDRQPRAGFVVSRAVGGAVVRNRVRRRVRHLVAARLDRFPAGSRIVVRALPPAATASGAQLRDALDSALDSALNSTRTARQARTGQDRRP